MRCLLVVSLFLSSFVWGSDIESLQKVLSDTQSYQARFQQQVLDAKGVSLQSVNGFMQVKRPGLFRWQTDAPFDQLLVANGSTLWVYDKDLEQVTIQALDQRVSQTPALLLSGDVKALGESYSVTKKNVNGADLYFLRPLGEDSLFESLSLVFDGNALIEMHLEDGLGQKTTISFLNVKVNPVLKKEIFEFEIPEGVDVIDDVVGA
jgi:outer membrane lipoprotein carrier protein